MALSSVLNHFSPGLILISLTVSSLLTLLVYRAFFGPLSHIPGPLVCRLTSLWTYYHSYIGDECTLIDELHKTYGPVIRIAPNEVCISDGAALAPIYSEKGGFLKAPCYTNFDIEGHRTIFSALDPGHRAIRSKPVLPMFSMSNIRNGNDAIEACVEKFVDRMKAEATASRAAKSPNGLTKPINILNLTRSLALDAICSYLFNSPFGSIDETEKGSISAASFVDTLVAVGRFFFLPNWIFLALEETRLRFFQGQEEQMSFVRVSNFAQGLLATCQQTEGTYQQRLAQTGISDHEVKIQCEDLIFAGTDSTGMNLSTICWYLAKQPDIYKTLCMEVERADARWTSYNPQNLQYLDAVIREGLRISMANPTRLPRIAPSQGFSFTAKDGRQYAIPGGTLVGLQIYTLHFNPGVYPDPFEFKPDRWLDSPSREMQRDWIPFGLGPRQCIARNLAMQELYLAVRAIARARVLEGAEVVSEKIEILEWFNSRVIGERIDLAWS